jgi:hypothetical protein
MMGIMEKGRKNGRMEGRKKLGSKQKAEPKSQGRMKQQAHEKQERDTRTKTS